MSMRGYWEDPETTDKVLKPGPLPGERILHTGDLFRSDEEGFLYFVGRKDDMIMTRDGRKIVQVDTIFDVILRYFPKGELRIIPISTC
jgi:long-subunit acyl-CoA synthetase (AMP-forming)